MMSQLFIDHAFTNLGQPHRKQERINGLGREMLNTLERIGRMARNGESEKDIEYQLGRMRGLRYEMDCLMRRGAGVNNLRRV